MSPDPTPAAVAATPAVLPLSAERQKHVLHVCASRGDVDYCDECFDEWPCQVALLGMLDAAVAQRDAADANRQGMTDRIEQLEGICEEYAWKEINAARVQIGLEPDVSGDVHDATEPLVGRTSLLIERLTRERDAARADLAEFARQTREAQASMMAAIKDKEQERQRAGKAEKQRDDIEACWQDFHAAALVSVRQANAARKWAETRASHWRRQEDLVMIRLAQRSNELGRANLAHRTALAQERQARERAEQLRDAQIELLDKWRRDQALEPRCQHALAAPASPAVEPAE
jgi:hypothetical protein